jgi:hypothetical protein
MVVGATVVVIDFVGPAGASRESAFVHEFT